MENRTKENMVAVGMLLLQFVVWLACTAFAVWVFWLGWNLFGHGFFKSALGIVLMLMTFGEVISALVAIIKIIVGLFALLFTTK